MSVRSRRLCCRGVTPAMGQAHHVRPHLVGDPDRNPAAVHTALERRGGEEEFAVLPRQRPDRREHQIGVARGLVHVQVDRDHELEPSERAMARLVVGVVTPENEGACLETVRGRTVRAVRRGVEPHDTARTPSSAERAP